MGTAPAPLLLLLPQLGAGAVLVYNQHRVIIMCGAMLQLSCALHRTYWQPRADTHRSCVTWWFYIESQETGMSLHHDGVLCPAAPRGSTIFSIGAFLGTLAG